MNDAIILCSGGVDSIVTSYYVKKKLGYKNITILFFNYNQKSLSQERKCSKKCASNIGADFMGVELSGLAKFSTSFIHKAGKVRKLSRRDLKDTSKESDKWYVPNRNSVFLSYALAIAEYLFVKRNVKNDIFVGFKCEGGESYPDTTKRFIREINELSKIATLGKFRVFAPLIEKDKEDIIILGKRLGVNFNDTFSCYIGKNRHCGFCLACKLRQEGFYWAGVNDPTEYNNSY